MHFPACYLISSEQAVTDIFLLLTNAALLLTLSLSSSVLSVKQEQTLLLLLVSLSVMLTYHSQLTNSLLQTFVDNLNTARLAPVFGVTYRNHRTLKNIFSWAWFFHHCLVHLSQRYLVPDALLLVKSPNYTLNTSFKIAVSILFTL